MRLLLPLVLLFPTGVLAQGIGGKKKETEEVLPPIKSRDASLEGRLRELEKEISAARGLEFKTPVSVKVIPRAGADPKKQGFYDAATKTLYLFDDIKGSYEKGVLVHEMVHALQDQHFNLLGMGLKLHEANAGNDALMALEALIEGDAVYTMIEVLKKEQPKITAMLDVPLEKATQPRNAFLYAQGARYVKALKEGKGGWAAVDAAYSFPPSSTAAIFHLRPISTVRFGPGPMAGAFGLWAKLHENPETRPVALKLAQAWRGDRALELGTSKAFVFAMRDVEHAKLLSETLEKLAGKGGDPFFDIRHQVIMEGNRVVFLTAVGEKALLQLRDRVFAPLRLQVYDSKNGRLMSYGDFIEELLGRDIVCIGEQHDHELHHRAQLQIIKSLYARDERLGVGLEMFQLPFQKAIERYWAGKISEEEFLKESEYFARWGFDWSMYKPIIEFARRNQIPFAALNAPRELTSLISKGGWEALSDDDRKLLGPVDFMVKEHRDWWFDRLAKMHGDDKAPPDRKERSYQVMTTWDDVMGRTAAAFQKAHGLKRMVVLAGIGHIEHGFGIPFRAARLHGASVATVGIMVNPPGVPLEGTGRIYLDGRPMTDFVILIRDE